MKIWRYRLIYFRLFNNPTMIIGRSEFCLGSGERGVRVVSSSPDSGRRRTGERRSADRKHSGGDSSSSKNLYSRERGRSKSPRRNSWREDIKKISSWKEDKKFKMRDVKLVARYHSSKGDREQRHHSEKRPRNVSSREEEKHSVEGKQIAILRKDRPSLNPKSQNEVKNDKDKLGRKFEDNPLKRKLIGFAKREVRSKAEREAEERKGKYLSPMKEEPTVQQINQRCDSDSDELELGISDKDVFPELRDEGSGSAS